MARPALHEPIQVLSVLAQRQRRGCREASQDIHVPDKEEIEGLAREHAENPGLRPLQKRLAKELTVMVQQRREYNAAVEASQILFSNKAQDALRSLTRRRSSMSSRVCAAVHCGESQNRGRDSGA